MTTPLRWLCCLSLMGSAAFAASVPAEFPELLREAMTSVSREADFWAYTETTSTRVQSGKASRVRSAKTTIVRFDPSKPYAEQYRPVQVDSHAPTEKDLKKYREKGEKRGVRLERPETAPEVKAKKLSDFVDFEHITAIDDGNVVVYAVPLRKATFRGIAMDKFQLSVRVNKVRGTLEHAAVRLKDSLRMKLVMNLKAGEFEMDFASVDSSHAPVMTAVRGDFAFSLLFFIKGTAIMEQSHSDFQRVKPYRDRFGVDIGPLKILDF